MRGDDNQQEGMFSYISPEQRVPADHPLRPIRKMVDDILKEMSPMFRKLYSDVGRPSIAPERLLRAPLLQVLYTVRSERMLIEQLQYNLLFRWFVGMEMDEAVWNHAVYSKNRERLLNEEIAESFFQRVLERARPLMSDEHFTVDYGSFAIAPLYDVKYIDANRIDLGILQRGCSFYDPKQSRNGPRLASDDEGDAHADPVRSRRN